MHVSTIILRVDDMARSIVFYRDEVGLSLLSESPAFSFFDAGSVRLVLNQPAVPIGADNSLTEIVFEVDDVHDVHAIMSGRGVDFRVDPREVMRDGERALHAADFTDPDGHVISITGWV